MEVSFVGLGLEPRPRPNRKEKHMTITKKTRLLAAEPKGPLLTGVHAEGLPVGQIKAGEPLILTGVGLGGQISSAVAIALDLQ